MSRSVNELLRDANVRRKVGLGLYANGMVHRFIATLNKADAELFVKLTDAMDSGATDFKLQRLEGQLSAVRQMNAALYERIINGLETDLNRLSEAELGFHGELLAEPIPGLRLPMVAAVPSEVYAATVARPFQGRLLREWGRDLGEARMLRMRDAIRMGYMQGETIDQIVRRVRGSRALAYADGILQIDRRSAEAVVRTAVSHTASVAREATFSANLDLMKAVQWVSTLDGRTSSVCRVRDGLRYTCTDHKPIGHKVPWLGGPGQAHWNCRSTATPVLKSFKDLGLNLPDLPVGVRASMDGGVPADTTYGQWFAKQSATRQDSIVGPARGKLFRSGEVTFDQFTNDKGRTLTLVELAEFSQG